MDHSEFLGLGVGDIVEEIEGTKIQYIITADYGHTKTAIHTTCIPNGVGFNLVAKANFTGAKEEVKEITGEGVPCPICGKIRPNEYLANMCCKQ